MEKSIFRKKSIERISSPEQLGDYVKVSNPGVWMVLSAILILLAGALVWGIFGHLDTKIHAAVISRDGQLTCYVKEAEAASIQAGMPVVIEGTEYVVSGVSEVPVTVTEEFDSYVLYLSGLQVGEWVYEVTVNGSLKDGAYRAEIITERISPMSFLVN